MDPARASRSKKYGTPMKKYSLYFLVLANLTPITGIIFLDWDLFTILFFYWLESAIVGIFNIPRMMLANAQSSSVAQEKNVTRTSHKISAVSFFLIHYSGFMAGHGFFIFELFKPDTMNLTFIWPGVLFLTISHGVSFVINFLFQREYQKVTISQQMIAPYRRILVMHITIFVCGFLISLLGSPQVTLIILVVFKIVIDIMAHFKEHNKLGTYLKNQIQDNAMGCADE